MMWPNWMRNRVEEVLLREVGKFVSEQHEVLFMERFVNGDVSWILEVRWEGEETVRRHELTDDELQHGLGLLSILNTTLIRTPITAIRARVEERD